MFLSLILNQSRIWEKLKYILGHCFSPVFINILCCHCVKSVPIRSFFWSEYRKIQTRKYPFSDNFHAVCNKYHHASWIRLAVNQYETFHFVSLRIQPECGKIRTRNNSVFGHFSLSGLCSWHLAVNYFCKWFQHRSHCAWGAHIGSFSETYFAVFVLIAAFVHKYPHSVGIFAYNVKYTLIMR